VATIIDKIVAIKEARNILFIGTGISAIETFHI
jgi:hypothetical protein